MDASNETRKVTSMVVRYPWADWFRAKEFILRKNKHYTISSYMMAQQVRNYATSIGVLVNLKVHEDTIEVKVDRE